MNRKESDPMGTVEVPQDAYFGPQTQRAMNNFHFSSLRLGRRFIWAHSLIKCEAARVNKELGVVESHLADAIIQAADEVALGNFDDQFAIDLFQTGSGTSNNMNMNEVVANRANEILGAARGVSPVHPNDHVNAGQSSNDTIPTALHLAAVASVREDLIPALSNLASSIRSKADEIGPVVKVGRTHLMDALPIRFDQEFGGYASQIEFARQRIERVLPDIEELALGSTVVGTGINAPPGFAASVIAGLAARTGYPLIEARDHFEALASKDGVVMVSGALRSAAIALFKIANDLRWLNSGPAGGIGEIRLEPLQPGSSIIPGVAKVNAVICEAVMMAMCQIIGNDSTISWAGANGNFELNVMMPVMAHNLDEAISLLASSANSLAEKAFRTLEIDEERCQEILERNVTTVTALTPLVGYDIAAAVAAATLKTKSPLRQVIADITNLDGALIDKVIDFDGMTRGGRLGTVDKKSSEKQAVQ